MQPSDWLQRGVEILAPVLTPCGFEFRAGEADTGSGGPFATGTFVRADRRLEVHFRWSLGLVSYHAAGHTVSHESFMAAVIGRRHASHYPGFSDDPLQAFRDLALDLRESAGVFLNGSDDEFRSVAVRAEQIAVVRGLNALSDPRAT